MSFSLDEMAVHCMDNDGSQLIVNHAPEKGVDLIQRAFGSTTLVAISPDGGGILGCWLDVTTLNQASKWASSLNEAGFNLYFTLNETLQGLARKAKKGVIIALRGVGADIDAKGGRDMKQALSAVTAVQLPPSLIIMSGGGWQPLWLLNTPIAVTAESVQRIERIGKQIAQLTGGDPVHNIDRIYRIPFTTNFPDAKKRAEGRTTCVSGILIRPRRK